MCSQNSQLQFEKRFCLTLFICQITVVLFAAFLLYFTLVNPSSSVVNKENSNIVILSNDDESLLFNTSVITNQASTNNFTEFSFNNVSTTRICSVKLIHSPCDSNNTDNLPLDDVRTTTAFVENDEMIEYKDLEQNLIWNACQQWSQLINFSSSSNVCSTSAIVNVRKRGIDLKMEDCKKIEMLECSSDYQNNYNNHEIDLSLRILACFDGDCNMTGIFNCSTYYDETVGDELLDDDDDEEFEESRYRSFCEDVTYNYNIRQCSALNEIENQFNNNPNEYEIQCQDQETQICKNLSGIFKCQSGECFKVLDASGAGSCMEPCKANNIYDNSIIVKTYSSSSSNNYSYLALLNCGQVIEIESGKTIWPPTDDKKEQSSTDLQQILIIFCIINDTVIEASGDYIFKDCFNGVIMEISSEIVFSNKSTAIVYLENLFANEFQNNKTDLGHVGPTESDLTIFKSARLNFSFQDCINNTKKKMSSQDLINDLIFEC